MREEIELLENHADPLAEHMGTFLEIRIQLGSGPSRNAGTGSADDSGIQIFQTIDAAQHRAFTTTRRTDDRDQIAFLDGEAHAFKNRRLIKTFVEILDRNDRRRIHCARFPTQHIGVKQGLMCDFFNPNGEGSNKGLQPFHSLPPSFSVKS
jgi:hypothetical protein